jgi:hypothetical protein
MNSGITPAFEEFIRTQTDKMRDLWFSSTDQSTPLPDEIPLCKKIENEARVTNLLEWINKRLETSIRGGGPSKDFAREAADLIKNAGHEILQLTEEEMNSLNELGMNESATNFVKCARDFDPFMPFDEIFQASRNVWTSNYLQALLGLPVSLTPSIFAYSMLYPVSDNFLDDPQRSRGEKVAFNLRFRAWLEGREADPRDRSERDALDLVRMIESQYPRNQFSQVYDSLLAIHTAQDKSMRLPKAPVNSTLVDIVSISFEKGGTSVLADGVLAAGELTLDEMAIVFNYGAFAQLMDDQEDLAADLKDGSVTLFTEAARAGRVDHTMQRVFAFAHQVLKGLDQFDAPQAQALKRMSMKGIDLLLIDAVLRTEKFYSRGYLNQLEKRFPVRFAYLKRVRKEISKKKITAERLIKLFMPNGIENSLPILVDPTAILLSVS